jgi:hypothetical protein
VRELERVSSEDVVLAWVRSEYNSRQPAHAVLHEVLHGAEHCIDERASTEDPDQNCRRELALTASRGYPHCWVRYERFPRTLDWFRVVMSYEDLGELLYTAPDWIKALASRRVGDGVLNVASVSACFAYIREKVDGIADAPPNDESDPELIVVAPDGSGPYLLLDGHGRATAYRRTLAREAEIRVLAGYSLGVVDWSGYPKDS